MLYEVITSEILDKLADAKLIEITEDKRIAPVKLKEQIDLVSLYENTSSFKLGAPKELAGVIPKLNESLSLVEDKLKEELKKISFKDLI